MIEFTKYLKREIDKLEKFIDDPRKTLYEQIMEKAEKEYEFKKKFLSPYLN